MKEEIKMLRVKIIEKKAIEKLEAEVNWFLRDKRDSVQTVEYASVKKGLLDFILK